MTTSRSPKKSAAGAPGARALITAASLAITLGGWAAFTRTSSETAATAGPAPVALALARPADSLDLGLQPLPTIVPPPQPPSLAIDRPPAVPADRLGSAAPAEPQPQAPIPAVSAPLRVVGAPPQPVARTRSSR
jgi:hypothetical protein